MLFYIIKETFLIERANNWLSEFIFLSYFWKYFVVLHHQQGDLSYWKSETTGCQNSFKKKIIFRITFGCFISSRRHSSSKERTIGYWFFIIFLLIFSCFTSSRRHSSWKERTISIHFLKNIYLFYIIKETFLIKSVQQVARIKFLSYFW